MESTAKPSMPRLLWEPLWPRVFGLLQSAPQHPLEATLGALVFLPFALPLAFVLVPILTGDAIVQFVYDNFGGPLEIAYEDGGPMLRIAFNSAALAGKETTRVVNQVVRNVWLLSG